MLRIIILFACFYNCFAKTSNPINWSLTISKDSLYSAQSTWDEHFRNALHPSIDYAAFMKAANVGVYFQTSVQELLAMGMQNHRLFKYNCAKDAETAYPIHDRPRNHTDIASVNYLSTTKDPVSPIVLVQVIDRKGRTHLIKLDGMHRLVAACIRRSPVRCYLINLGRASTYKNTKALLKSILTLK